MNNKKIFIIETSKQNIFKNTSNSSFYINLNLAQLLNETYYKYESYNITLKSITIFPMNTNNYLFQNMSEDDKAFKIMISGLPFKTGTLTNSNLQFETLLTNFTLPEGKDFDNACYLEFDNIIFTINKEPNCVVQIKYIDFINNELKPNTQKLNIITETDITNTATAYYPLFTNGSDISINNYNLINVGTPVYGKVLSRDCVTLNGIDEFLNLIPYINYAQTADLSIACWIKYININAADGRATIFSITDTDVTDPLFAYFIFGVNDNGQLFSQLGDDNPSGTRSLFSVINVQPLNDDKWHHVVCVYGTTKRELWIDGVLNNIASNTTLITQIPALDNLYVGARSVEVLTPVRFYQPQNFFEGSISKLSVYNKELTADEINALYTENDGSSAYPDMKYIFEICQSK